MIDEWNYVLIQTCQKLIESMPATLCRAVIDSKWFPTKYYCS